MKLFCDFTNSNNKKDGSKRYLHNLSKGDHVVRWDRIVVYPIQVHGIVLSASDDVVTIVDFGLTAASSSSSSSSSSFDKKGTDNDNSVNNTNVNVDVNTPLEEMVNHEDRAMMKTCEDHRHEMLGPDRINILVLTEEKEIKSWRKVEYAVEKKKKGKFHWWWDNNNSEKGEKNKEDKEVKEAALQKEGCAETQNETQNETEDKMKTNNEKSDDGIIENDCHNVGELSENNKDVAKVATIPELTSEERRPNNKNNEEENNNNNGPHSTKKAKTESHSHTSTNTNKNKEKELPEPLLTRSDPTTIVLSRVRYLVSNPHVLPPHHIFYSNSECIAVWCKTGVWSTLQASIYLHSTAAGNFKSAVTAAAAVGGSTVTTTVPASGIGGWFGMTTTTTVSLISVQPWIIPALAGYGIIAVGGPYIVLRKCHEQWRKATTELNDKFWGELDADVYVEAIKSWSGLD